MKRNYLFIVVLLLMSCATYNEIEKTNQPDFFYYRDPTYFNGVSNNTFYHFKGYQIYFSEEYEYHWTPIIKK